MVKLYHSIPDSRRINIIVQLKAASRHAGVPEKKERYKSDPVYRKKQLDGQKAWREKRPSHQYQRAYREDHPEYVKRNRNLQRERNKKRQGDPVPMIVNGTSLFTQGSNEEAYAVFKIKNEKIVNGTSFIARMKILSRKEAILVQHGL